MTPEVPDRFLKGQAYWMPSSQACSLLLRAEMSIGVFVHCSVQLDSVSKIFRKRPIGPATTRPCQAIYRINSSYEIDMIAAVLARIRPVGNDATGGLR